MLDLGVVLSIGWLSRLSGQIKKAESPAPAKTPPRVLLETLSAHCSNARTTSLLSVILLPGSIGAIWYEQKAGRPLKGTRQIAQASLAHL
jgi:hypothetical protein